MHYLPIVPGLVGWVSAEIASASSARNPPQWWVTLAATQTSVCSLRKRVPLANPPYEG